MLSWYIILYNIYNLYIILESSSIIQKSPDSSWSIQIPLESTWIIRNPPDFSRIIQNIISGLNLRSKVFCKMDAVQGYHLIPLDEASSLLTTFFLPWGFFQYQCAGMGQCQPLPMIDADNQTRQSKGSPESMTSSWKARCSANSSFAFVAS